MQQSAIDQPVAQKKELIPRHVYLKVQLPSLFTIQDEVELQITGYSFDPSRKLSSTKQLPIIRQQNVGSIITTIKEEVKTSLSFYEEKSWKNIQRQLPAFTFQLEINLRVIRINAPSIQVKPLFGSRSELFEMVQLNLEAQSEESLKYAIQQASKMVITSLQNHKIQPSRWELSLAPHKIFNPHLFIKTQTKDKYVEYYAKGLYEYYHYGDQSLNDYGWGCAYRSLQSLLSWLSLQNHLKMPKMLTISQIQQLIDRINLGSKDKLRDSREWIGATEVSWVVKHLTNYDCRILHISDGKKIIEECETLREHFQKVGSPVMYGGGEYAYSIVGLNYSWKLGECQFLILDPHYTGPDTIDKILQKKGLSWRKPEEMFKKGIFYNFCLPIIN